MTVFYSKAMQSEQLEVDLRRCKFALEGSDKEFDCWAKDSFSPYFTREDIESFVQLHPEVAKGDDALSIVLSSGLRDSGLIFFPVHNLETGDVFDVCYLGSGRCGDHKGDGGWSWSETRSCHHRLIDDLLNQPIEDYPDRSVVALRKMLQQSGMLDEISRTIQMEFADGVEPWNGRCLQHQINRIWSTYLYYVTHGDFHKCDWDEAEAAEQRQWVHEWIMKYGAAPVWAKEFDTFNMPEEVQINALIHSEDSGVANIPLFQSTCWHNNASPSWFIQTQSGISPNDYNEDDVRGLMLWIDYPQEMSDCPYEFSGRYSLSFTNQHGEEMKYRDAAAFDCGEDHYVRTNDWSKVVLRIFDVLHKEWEIAEKDNKGEAWGRLVLFAEEACREEEWLQTEMACDEGSGWEKEMVDAMRAAVVRSVGISFDEFRATKKRLEYGVDRDKWDSLMAQYGLDCLENPNWIALITYDDANYIEEVTIDGCDYYHLTIHLDDCRSPKTDRNLRKLERVLYEFVAAESSLC